MSTRTASRSGGRTEPEEGSFGSALNELVDNVSDIARARAASLARAADREADRLEARLRRLALLSGVCLAAGVLLVSGAAGGLGELAGRHWLGQLVTGSVVLVGVVVWAVIARRRNLRKGGDDIDEQAAFHNLAEAGRSLPVLALAGAAGWVAGLFLGQRKRPRR
jgi:hypothetical protein